MAAFSSKGPESGSFRERPEDFRIDSSNREKITIR
jgi:hypothetical protein